MTTAFRAALLIATITSGTPSANTSSISVSDAWSRATMSTEAGGVYLTIVNRGVADNLVGVDTPIATQAQLHEMTMTGNVMAMRPLADLPIAAGQTIRLNPNGDHIMLDSMTHPLRMGQSFPITLHLRHAGAVTVVVHVGSAGAQGPTTGMPKGMSMPMGHGM